MTKKKKKGGKGFARELPEKFVERLSAIFGQARFREIEKTFVARPTTFRINLIRATAHEVLPRLSEEGFKVQKVLWCKDAYILCNKTKRELTESKVYTEGKIYIQSLASMVPPLVLDPQPGEKILDLTAAPGSKTSQIAALMQKQGELIANDKNTVRFFKLKHNMEMLGVTEASDAKAQPHPNPPLKGEGNAIGSKEVWRFVLRMEHGAGLSREYTDYFDKILLDAPCSAEARFDTTDPKSFGYWSERKIKEMAYTQRILLRSAWHMLRPGGILVYSTCTYAPEENEVQLQKFLEHSPDAEMVKIELSGLQSAVVVDSFKHIVISEPIKKNAFRILPTSQVEGFFVAKVRKNIVE